MSSTSLPRRVDLPSTILRPPKGCKLGPDLALGALLVLVWDSSPWRLAAADGVASALTNLEESTALIVHKIQGRVFSFV
ncbi:hypothetical protein BDN72DRAFT_894107 [Pluteus cervinus]|uniref:Uncharacterized protein n=1 Tax=Pluteus cervinus TaxID=181527 RepID=A0ACD3B5U7_9AGAR|nr:hypothetical protein BDN72DRAFT_894107 [Pluteus cervinus]